MSEWEVKAKYRNYSWKILEFLATKTDKGSALVSVLRAYGKVPKSSLTNVLADMESNGLVEGKKWFNKQKMIFLTEEGRKQYLDILAKPGEYAIPYAVKNYLDKREPHVKDLFPIQQDFVERGLLLSADNVCAFAYPGTGKTLVAEMAMAEKIANGGRALYCTPYKALDWQKYEEFSRSFSHLGVEVAVTDGDNPVRYQDLERAKVVVGTYERIAGALRRNEPWLASIDLMCADEITLLAEAYRGSTMDLLLTLMKRAKPNLRMITLASIIGNPLAIADWLGAKPVIRNIPLPSVDIEESVVYKRNEELTFMLRDGSKRVEQTKDDAVSHLIRRNIASGETTLVFVGPRRDAEGLAAELKSVHSQSQELTELVEDFERVPFFERTKLTAEVCQLLKFGVAFHHAGLHKRVRRFVEKLLSEGKLTTIVATGTLSHGVDFKIDSVIIDLESVRSAHPLHCFEYINYKGRAGRPGKSASASVYLVCDESNANDAFSKYFIHSPEDILPKTVLMTEELGTMALAAAASKGGITTEELGEVIMSTLSARQLKGKQPQLRGLLPWLGSLGFVRKEGQRYELTDLGRKANNANIAPMDALAILKIGRAPSTRDLISLGVSIDLVLQLRKTSARKRDPTEMLLDWIEEMPIDVIKEKYHGYWDDGDILQLGEYTSIALDKIATFLQRKELTKTIELLKERLRYGVKQDIVKAGLTGLPLIIRNRARVLARDLRSSGYAQLKQLSREKPQRLATKLSITESQANSIIEDCKNLP